MQDHGNRAASVDTAARFSSIWTFRNHDVRVVDVDGTPYVVAKDVTEILGYTLASDFARDVDPQKKGKEIVHTPGGPQKMTVVNELGVYQGLTHVQGNLAERFQEWLWEHLRDYRKVEAQPGTFRPTASR